MNSLRDIVELSPQLRVIETQAMYGLQGQDAAQPLAPPRWNWGDVRKVLLVSNPMKTIMAFLHTTNDCQRGKASQVLLYRNVLTECRHILLCAPASC